jgi:hypothetical protein
VLAALVEGTVLTESMARTVCGWTDKLPADCRESADEILLAAARAGAHKEDLAALAAEIYARSLPEDQDDPEQSFEDRNLRVETTFAGAGVLSGDLTPECTAVVTAVLDALSAPMGAEDTRTKEQRYHDALQDAMRRLVAAGLLPARAGQPVKVWAHVTLAELRAMDDGSVLAGEWIAEMAIRWAARRAESSDGSGGDGGAWLDGNAARAMACDALINPVVTGNVDPGVLDDLVRLCVQLDRLDHGTTPDSTGTAPDGTGTAPNSTAASRTPVRAAPRRPLPAALRTPLPAAAHGPSAPAPPARRRPGPALSPSPVCRRGCCPGRRCGGRSSARPWTCCPVPAGWPRSCGPGSWVPGWPGRACRWTSGTAPRSRRASATR